MRLSAPRNSLLTHTASRPMAISDGPSAAPTATVAVTTPRAGSMRDTMPSGGLTTHTPSAVAATAATPRPTWIVRTAVAARALISVTVPAAALLTQTASAVHATRAGWPDRRTVAVRRPVAALKRMTA